VHPGRARAPHARTTLLTCAIITIFDSGAPGSPAVLVRTLGRAPPEPGSSDTFSTAPGAPSFVLSSRPNRAVERPRPRPTPSPCSIDTTACAAVPRHPRPVTPRSSTPSGAELEISLRVTDPSTRPALEIDVVTAPPTCAPALVIAARNLRDSPPPGRARRTAAAARGVRAPRPLGRSRTKHHAQLAPRCATSIS